jgi:hypothetical protein
MPYNVFVSGTLGGASYSFDYDEVEILSTKSGIGWHFKVGKEWWVSRNWGLGVALGYGYAGAKDRSTRYHDYMGIASSHRFHFLLNTTYN